MNPHDTPHTAHPPDSPFEIARERLIVALDVPTAEAALALAERLEDQCQWFKVGLELYIAAGPAIVEKLVSRGHSIFLDLKLHDIPNTVAAAVRSAASLGANLLTVHASGGLAMLAAAQEAVSLMATPPQLLAVTVLTSMDATQLSAVGIERLAALQVLRLAETAAQSGINGLVASAQEAAELRKRFPAATLVIPGIRPAGSEIGDQKRTATPAAALAAGASYLVVGRPITQAHDPVAATQAILDEMHTASPATP